MTENTQGKTTVSPDVLTTIARLAALSVPGVSRLAPISGGVNRFFKRGAGDGVRIETEENTVYADLHLVLQENVNIREADTSRVSSWRLHISSRVREPVLTRDPS